MQDKTEKGFSLNHDQIEQYLEISHPFLMIDYVEEIIPGKSAHGIKILTEDDWFLSVICNESWQCQGPCK